MSTLRRFHFSRRNETLLEFLLSFPSSLPPPPTLYKKAAAQAALNGEMDILLIIDANASFS